jgi:cell division protein FtsW (lipid II flippase)
MQGVGQSAQPAGIGRTYDAPTDRIARADKKLVSKMIRRPLAWIPVAMSLAILAMVLTTLGLSGAVRQEDEGTQAHIFQIWLILEGVLVTVFAVAWVPRRPRQALVVLAIQILCVLAACAPVFYFRL